jgi:hypothetical protein
MEVKHGILHVEKSDEPSEYDMCYLIEHDGTIRELGYNGQFDAKEVGGTGLFSRKNYREYEGYIFSYSLNALNHPMEMYILKKMNEKHPTCCNYDCNKYPSSTNCFTREFKCRWYAIAFQQHIERCFV